MTLLELEVYIADLFCMNLARYNIKHSDLTRLTNDILADFILPGWVQLPDSSDALVAILK